MTGLSHLVIIFGYMAILVLILGLAYRIWNWGRLPTGFSWGVFPKPTKWVVTSVIWKAFAWPTLFKGDRLLWELQSFSTLWYCYYSSGIWDYS